MKGLIETDRLLDRAVVLLSRPGTWLAREGEMYRVRVSPDGRRRAPLTVDEAVFARLTEEPGLAVRPEGGWRLARAFGREDEDRAGRPGVEPGERVVMEGSRAVKRAANLGESPIQWLARRKDAQGRPWLTPVEAAAGERLRDDHESAGRLGRLTMSWDGAPRSRSARGAGRDPLEHGRHARARVAAALEAVGPELKGVLEQVCLRETSLSLAERELGLPPRAGKTVLKLALQRLAAHYRMK